MRAIRSQELADRAFARHVDEVPPRDRAWLHELTYGTLRLRGRIDYVLAQFVKKGLASLDDDVLDILRLATYQLLEMHSVPAYAAVSQAVEQTKSLRRRGASGLVNGVLQSIRRAGADIAPHDLALIDQLSAWGSHPRWLVERWLARFGASETEQLIAANNTRPEIFVRPIGRAANGDVEHAPDAERLRDRDLNEVLESAIVQDPAAGLIVRYASPEGGVVADLCAAPGGKAIAMADALRGNGFVIAADISMARMRRVVENVNRFADLPVKCMIADARSPALHNADLVAIDAPCTGTGTFRRHPDGKWRVQPDDLVSLVRLQRDILDAASEVVKVGGFLVYSTCSLEPEENQEQVSAFLDTHPNFLRRPPAQWHDDSLIDEIGNLVVLPHVHGFDGSFAARMERIS